MRFLYLIYASLLALPLYALEDFDRQQLEKRIKPLGQVKVEGKVIEAQKDASSPTTATNREELGQATYERYCIVCHKDGLAGAPKFRNKEDWTARLAKEKNLDALVAIAVKGLNAMPPKGTCQDCSDKELKEAIQYMLPKS